MVSTQRRIISAYLFLVLFPVLFSGSVFYTAAAAVFRSISDRQALRTLKATDLALRSALREIDVVSDLAICSDGVQNLLAAVNGNPNIDPLVLETMKRNAVGSLSANVHILGATLYGRGRLVLEYGEGSAPPIASFTASAAFSQAVRAGGRPVWLGPAENSYLFTLDENRRLCFSQVRLVKDFYTLDDIGCLVLHLDPELIDSLFFELFQGEDDGVFLLNDERLVLFGNDASLIGKRLAVFNGMADDSAAGVEGSFLTRWQDRPVLASYLRSDTGWLLVSLSSWERLERAGAFMRNAVLILFLPVLGIAFFFNFYFMRRFTSFVDRLSKSMHRLRGGDLAVRLEPIKGEEYRLLSDDFNSMAERLQQLVADIQREQIIKRDAEFRLLQAQIKPHFLYNTLESINALASLHGEDEIQKITVNLGKLLRLSIARDDFLSVGDEIAQVRAYLEIQKIRYSRRFEYVIDVDSRLLKYRIIKLILQPVVENAIYHGFETYESGGKIMISGGVETAVASSGGAAVERGWFMIADNGGGIPEEALAGLAQAAAGQIAGAAAGPEIAVGHGIISVYKRLRITYGAAAGLAVGKGEEGTVVRILFPLREA